MTAEHTIDLSAEVPVTGAQSPIKSSLSIKTSERNVGLLGDKPFNERTVERNQNGELFVKTAVFPYADAVEFFQRTAEAAREAAAQGLDEAEATGLDERFDELVERAGEFLQKTSVNARLVLDPSGKKNVQVKVLHDGNEVLNFDGADTLDPDLGPMTSAGLDDPPCSDAGAEEVLDNGGTAPRRRGFIAGYRATADGENDSIDDEITNTLVQTKGGFIVISAADLNLNFGVNAKIAIFIA